MKMEVNSVVSQLLLNTNCVVIPGLGGFVANPIAARIDYARGTITPPTKALSFNINLTHNDGLLVHEVAKTNGLDYEHALSNVLHFSKQSNNLLAKGERVNFPNVGFLFLNEAGKVTFEQDRFFNLLLSSYGLGTVEFIPEEIVEHTVETTTQEKIVTVASSKAPVKEVELTETSQSETKTEVPVIELKPVEDKTSTAIEEPTKGTNTFRKVMRYAAVVALAPIAFYSFWIPMRTDVLQSGIIYKEDFNPFSQKSSERYIKTIVKDLDVAPVENYKSLTEIVQHLPEEVSIYSYGLTEEVFIPVRIRENKKDSEQNKQEVRTKITSTNKNLTNRTKNTKSYYLIAGAFGEQSNALRYVEKLKQEGHQDAHIVDYHRGLHRVAVSSFKSRNEAKLQHTSLKDNNLSTWILSR